MMFAGVKDGAEKSEVKKNNREQVALVNTWAK